MKKILFFHHCETIGGAGISGLNVVNSLDKNDYEITIYCASDDMRGMSGLFEENGFKVIRAGASPKIFSHFSGGEIPAWSPWFIKQLFEIHKDKAKIEKVILENDPDIVVMNSMTLFWIAEIAKKYKKETLLFFRETYTNGLCGIRTAYIKRQLNRFVDKIAFISDYENRLSKTVKSYKKTIYNATDGEKFTFLTKAECRQKINLLNDVFYILYIGGMSHLKGADIAIETMKYIKEPNIKMLFVGYKWNGMRMKVSERKGYFRKFKYLLGLNFESNCINKIIRNNLKEKIIFYPIQQDIAPFFVACDALIFPMTSPHQARPIFEAGYAKIPVVSTDFPQIREVCDESSGYLFENMNSKMLATRVLEIYENSERAKQKCEVNYKNTVTRHDISKYKKQINDLFSYHCNNAN